jgi:hypothetical protein
MKIIYNESDEPIPYKISDLLRGKCTFPTLDSANNCCQLIRDEI